MDDESINQEQIDRVREEFIRRRGWWGDEWEAVLRIDPEFIEKYGEWSHVPVKHRYLDPKVREFVWIAVDASVTHLYQPGLRRHIRNALRLGASKEEVMEVIELVSIIGIHSAAVAGPMIAEEAEILAQQAAGGNEPELDRNDDQERH